MKVGDIVKLRTANGRTVAIVVDVDDSGWLIVVDQNGREQMWPPQQMELVEKR